MNYYLLLTSITLLMYSSDNFGQNTFIKSIDFGGYDRGVTVEEIGEEAFIITGFTRAIVRKSPLLIETLEARYSPPESDIECWVALAVKSPSLSIQSS